MYYDPYAALAITAAKADIRVRADHPLIPAVHTVGFSFGTAHWTDGTAGADDDMAELDALNAMHEEGRAEREVVIVRQFLV